MTLTFKPKNGYVGDPIPFYWKGEYHVFYIKAPKNSTGFERLKAGWDHIVSKDLFSWRELPTALEIGDNSEPDADGVWTGSIHEHDGVFHIFYTGFNSNNKYEQAICHATSADLIKWEKDPRNPIIYPDEKWYEPNDWRDPVIFWNQGKKQFWMLIAARLKSGPKVKRGCIALSTSTDLNKWTVQEPFWAPYNTFCMECPDIFKLGNKWYLLYSRFSEKTQTVYRVSDNPDGPWRICSNEALDGRRFYAIRTAGDDNRRIAFGFINNRNGDNETGCWEWGGDLGIPRELTQNTNRGLDVKCPSEIINRPYPSIDYSFEPKIGKWSINKSSIFVFDTDGFAYGLFQKINEKNILFEIDLTLEQRTMSCGIFVRTKTDLTSGYLVRLQPNWQRVILEKWPEPIDSYYELNTYYKNILYGKNTPKAEFREPIVERPLVIIPGSQINVKVFITGDITEIFIDNKVSLTYRTYSPKEYVLGLFAEGGACKFDNVQIKVTNISK
jgi:beta-fructofuranosidase